MVFLGLTELKTELLWVSWGRDVRVLENFITIKATLKQLLFSSNSNNGICGPQTVNFREKLQILRSALESLSGGRQT